jgi:hypothetical protein
VYLTANGGAPVGIGGSFSIYHLLQQQRGERRRQPGREHRPDTRGCGDEERGFGEELPARSRMSR